MAQSEKLSELERLRARVGELDGLLLDIVSERIELGRAIADAKRAASVPQRDYAHEKRVVSRALALGEAKGVPVSTTESIILELIQACSTVEEQAFVRSCGVGKGRRVLVIGGSGKMGGWMTDFLLSQGFAVEIADLVPGDPRSPFHDDWRTLELDEFELIIVATPLGLTNGILKELATRRPAGIVFDVGSLKSPVREGLLMLRRAGVRVTSIHPMFGPHTTLLSGRHIIFSEVGAGLNDELSENTAAREALAVARSLFKPTTAVFVEMDLESHDRLIAYVLGLSHAVNIAFFTALAESGEAAPRLAKMSSTTFDAQLAIATDVSLESPELYFEIQALNDYGQESLAALSYAIERMRGVVRASDEEGFIRLMSRGRDYLAGRETS